MSISQIALFLIAATIFYIFFKKLFSGDYPKRGIDYEAKLPDEQIGGVSSPEKIFAQPKVQSSRLDELLQLADDSISKEDFEDAKKAILSALILDEKNIDVLQRAVFLAIQEEDFNQAVHHCEKIISLDGENDLAFGSLANTYHKLGEDDKAIEAHKKAISLDFNYAPHYFNYANTLYDLKKIDEAKQNYKKALELDDGIEEAQVMIDKIDSKEA
ncbi:MAG: tetratricopeptide repeat protein [Campylobacterales bacterium]|nr:tetratricopeptide repeat protein [Campylobacterales bacterium]